MKIFITGFQRSGTTLLRNLFSLHPEIKHVFHEQCVLRHFSSKKQIKKVKKLPDWITTNTKDKRGKYRRRTTVDIDFDMLNDSWGEKVPYYNLFFKKGFNGPFVNYCKLWNQYFYPDCKIVHIIRHPLDVGLSTKKRGYSKSVTTPIKKYKSTVIKTMNILEDFPNVITFKYEDLVTNPKKTLLWLFKQCELSSTKGIINGILDSDVYWFGYINADRAFNFKKEAINIEKHNLNKTIDVINKKVPGIKYELKR